MTLDDKQTETPRLLRVRLTNSEKWPFHATEEVQKLSYQASKNYQSAKWQEWRGAEILVAPPIDPDFHWTCKTKRVWQVCDDKLLDYFGVRPEYRRQFYVCQHQIVPPRKKRSA